MPSSARRRGAPRRPCSASGRSRSAGRRQPRRAAARKPVSPVPAASSRIVWPGPRVEAVDEPFADLARRLPEQAAAPIPVRRHLLPQLVVGARRLHPPRGYSASSRASSSGEGSHSPAAAFARTCSGVVAPAITEATVGWAARPPIATSSGFRPRSRAKRSSASIRSHVASSTSSPCAARRVPSGAGPAAAVLAGQQTAREREVREQPDPEPLADRDQVALGLAREPRVLVLRRDERRKPALGRDAVGLLDLRRAQVRRADEPHLALAHELVHRAERLLDRGHAVGPVVLVEIDVVGAEPPQRAFDRRADVLRRAARDRVVVAASSPTELGRDHRPVAAPRERAAEEELAVAVAVALGRVEEA